MEKEYKMKYLITGGCGFIGTNIVKYILEKNNNSYIRIVDNLLSSSREKLRWVCKFSEPSRIVANKGKVHFFPFNIKNEQFALDICRDIDIIIHLAANTGVPTSVKFPRDDCTANVLGTLNYLEGARRHKVKKFIFASSSAVPGNHEPPYNEELFTRPVSPYGASKAAGESYCHVYSTIYGIESVSLRFSNVYGPFSENKEGQLIPTFIMNALKGKDLEIYGDGSQTRDYCYIDDLLDAIDLSITAPNISGQVFQIATNKETSVQTITSNIISVLSEHGVDKIIVKYCDERLGDVQRNFSDTSKAQRVLGWESKVDVEEGIRKTVEWFLKR
jgi:UDP-glucose 4-epimerase